MQNLSYFAVPGRGGASAGTPPAQAGMASLTPAASFSLMVPQPLRAQPASATARIVTIWRALIGIEGVATLKRGIWWIYGAETAPVSATEPNSQRVKLAYSTGLVLVMPPSRRFPHLARWQGPFPRDHFC